MDRKQLLSVLVSCPDGTEANAQGMVYAGPMATTIEALTKENDHLKDRLRSMERSMDLLGKQVDRMDSPSEAVSGGVELVHVPNNPDMGNVSQEALLGHIERIIRVSKEGDM